MTLSRLIATPARRRGQRRGRRACIAARPPTSTTPRTGSAPSPASSRRRRADRRRLAGRAALDQAVADRHRHRRAQGRRRQQHAGARAPGPRSRMRIAPGDTTENAVARLRDAPREARARGARSSPSPSSTRGEPIAIDATGPAYDAARAAFAEAWDGTAPVDMGVGGSIPFIADVPGGASRRPRPGHRRRGPGHPRARRQRGPAPRRVRAGLPRRGAAAAEPLRPRLDGPSHDGPSTLGLTQRL